MFAYNTPNDPTHVYLSIHNDVHTQLHSALSIDYLIRPLSVLGEVGRVLRPGGMVAIAFSNRLFIQKVCRARSVRTATAETEITEIEIDITMR